MIVADGVDPLVTVPIDKELGVPTSPLSPLSPLAPCMPYIP